MASARTIKTLAYLVAAMTAVTFVLSLVEPWTVSLRPTEARAARQAQPATLAAVRQPDWDRLELVLAASRPGQPTLLPRTHVIIHADGRLERTALWDSGQALPDKVLRVCAVYDASPSDALLRAWLAACDDTGVGRICLKTMPQTAASPGQARVLREIHRRLSAMLEARPSA
jgi:hypothetical protein